MPLPIITTEHRFDAKILTVDTSDINKLEQFFEAQLSEDDAYTQALLILQIPDHIQFTTPDAGALFDGIRELNIHLMAVICSDPVIAELAEFHGIRSLKSLNSLTNPDPKTISEAPQATSLTREQQTTYYVTMPLSTGETIQNHYGDVVVLAPVASGAVIKAVGNIMVHEFCEAELFAGYDSNTQAFIYTAALNAEAISIGSLYVKQHQYQQVKKDIPLLIKANGNSLNFSGAKRLVRPKPSESFLAHQAELLTPQPSLPASSTSEDSVESKPETKIEETSWSKPDIS